MACLTLREYISTVKTLKLLGEKECLKICFKRKGITEYYFPSIKPLWDWDNTDVGLKELEKKGLLDLYVIFDCAVPRGMYVSLTERDPGNIYLSGLGTLKIFKECENENFDDLLSKKIPKVETNEPNEPKKNSDKVSLVSLSIFAIGLILLILCFII